MWSPLNINVKSDFVGATVRRFGEEYEKRYKEVPGVIAIANYAAFDVITKAMQDARSLETDKVDLEVGAERGGVLTKIERHEGEDVKIGDVLGVTESRVSQLHTKAILRLRSRLAGAHARQLTPE